MSIGLWLTRQTIDPPTLLLRVTVRVDAAEAPYRSLRRITRRRHADFIRAASKKGYSGRMMVAAGVLCLHGRGGHGDQSRSRGCREFTRERSLDPQNQRTPTSLYFA